MNLWQNFEIGKTKYSNSGISLRYEKGIDKELRELYIHLVNWLRKTYVFPVHINIYIKNCEKIRLLNGRMAYGSIRFFDNKPPYIRIPSKIESKLYDEYDVEDIYDMVISSLIHELSHYYQWFLDLDQDEKTSERQANYFRYRILEKFYQSQD